MTTYTITHRIDTYQEDKDPSIIIEKHDQDGNCISELVANPETGQIMWVHTLEKDRLEGHARSLITYAIEHDIELYHSPEWSCSEPGGWAFVQACDEIDVIKDEDAYGWEGQEEDWDETEGIDY